MGFIGMTHTLMTMNQTDMLCVPSEIVRERTAGGGYTPRISYGGLHRCDSRSKETSDQRFKALSVPLHSCVCSLIARPAAAPRTGMKR